MAYAGPDFSYISTQSDTANTPGSTFLSGIENTALVGLQGVTNLGIAQTYQAAGLTYNPATNAPVPVQPSLLGVGGSSMGLLLIILLIAWAAGAFK